MGKDTLSGKRKYNNGIIAKYFIPGEQPDGWVEGSTAEKKQKILYIIKMQLKFEL